MQATSEQRIDTGHDLYSETKIIQAFMTHMKLSDDSHQEEEEEEEDHDSVNNNDDGDNDPEDEDLDDDDEEDDDYEEEEEEFSFMFEGANTPSMEAEDVKQVFPLFNRDLFFSGEGLKPLRQENLPTKLPVKKVFVETNERSEEGHLVMSASTPGSDEIAGPCCEWSGKAVAETSVACKKSNSTGFSKFWRFKDFAGRSNSDGKDAFVFLNKSQAPPHSIVKRSRKVGPPSPKAEIGKARKSVRGKTAPLSAHAVYLKNKAKQEDRRRSYLPYRPELMGFFTNANVGLTRNVHPY